MKNLRNKNAPPPETAIQTFLSSSWDKVLAVYAKLADIETIADLIDAGDFDDILTESDIDTLAELNAILTDATLGDVADFATAAQGVLADNSVQLPFATQGEAEAGVNNTRPMTPLRVAQAIAVLAAGIQNNLNASVPPTVNDDTGSGWQAGSFWIDNVAQESYRCIDPAVGAAVWVTTTLTADELATVAISGDSDDLTEGVAKLLMTVAERAKLAGIEAGATGDLTGSEIAALLFAEADTNNFDDAASTKLSGIEALADVTDAINVDAAGAIMDSDFSAADGHMRKTGAGTYEAIKDNMASAVDPAVTNDSSEGYAVDSRWFNTTLNKAFICLDASVGAAVWLDLTAAGGGGSGGLTPIFVTANYTAAAGEMVVCNTAAGGFWVKTPAGPSDLDRVKVINATDVDNVNPVQVIPDGSSIRFITGDLYLDQAWSWTDIAYDDGNTEWAGEMKGSPSIVYATANGNKVVNALLRPGQHLVRTAATLDDDYEPGTYWAFKTFPCAASSDASSFSWVTRKPANYIADSLRFRIWWMTDNTDTGDVEWDFTYTPSATDGEAPSFTSEGPAATNMLDAASGADNSLQATAWFSPDAGEPAWDAEDVIAFWWRRHGTSGNDDYTGTAHVMFIEVEYEVLDVLSNATEAAISNQIAADVPALISAQVPSNVHRAFTWNVPNMNDDTVQVLDFGADVYSGQLSFSHNNSGLNNYGGCAIRAAASSAYCKSMYGTGFNVTTGILTGTTGSDGTVTISTHTDNKLYIENRTGSVLLFTVGLNIRFGIASAG